MNINFTCLVKSKPVKQEVSHTVILPLQLESSVHNNVQLHGNTLKHSIEYKSYVMLVGKCQLEQTQEKIYDNNISKV